MTPSEQALLRRLAVFVDGWTLEAAEAICPDPVDGEGPVVLDAVEVFDALDRLVDHSLVNVSDGPTGVRFGMLETVRQYGSRLLEADPAERDAVRLRHSQHFCGWVIRVGDELILTDDADLFDGVTADRANIVAAAERAIGAGEPAVACDALGALFTILGCPEWASVNRSVLALVDALLETLDDVDRWRAYGVRRYALAIRADPISELATLEDMLAAAEAAGNAAGVAHSRATTLALLSMTGAPVFDEYRDLIELLEGFEPVWAAGHRGGGLLVMSAYAGSLRHYDAVLRDVDTAAFSPRPALLQLSAGVVALFRGQPTSAVDLLWASSDRTEQGQRSLAYGYLAYAHLDLGQAPDPEIERRLRRTWEIEENVLGGLATEVHALCRLLLADDLDGADALLRVHVQRFEAIGVLPSAFTPNHALVAAGLGMPPTATAHEGVTPLVAAETLRARAEHLLQMGELGSAMDAAHSALEVELAERLDRGIVHTLECVARILAAANRHDEAVRLTSASTAFRTERSLVALPCLRQLTDDTLARARAQIGPTTFDTAFAGGSTMSLLAATDYARRLRIEPHSTAVVGWDALTPTENRVADLVAQGLTNPQVGKELLMGAETVKTHLSRVFDKVGVANRKELIVAASRRAAER